jgi:hypothetical protein
MTPAYRLASVHLGLLLLSIPLIMPLYVDEAGTALDGSGTWAFVGVAAIYAIVAVTGKPMALFEGLGRLGVGGKAGRLLVVTVALFAASVAVYDVSGIGTALGVLAILGALALFLWAVGLALFSGTPDT